MARPELEAAVAAMGLTVESTFIPWSKSRSAVGAKTIEVVKAGKMVKVHPVTERSLNWEVILLKVGGRHPVLTTFYTAGIGHCPAYKKLYKGAMTVYVAEVIETETETGKVYAGMHGYDRGPILPDPIDVIWSLVQDADVIDYPTYEDWAENFGLDPDSRKGEAKYRLCLELALKLRAGIGEDGLKKLREASQDY